MSKYNVVSDPEVLAEKMTARLRGPGEKLVLGLDLGTTTGVTYAYYDPNKKISLKETKFFVGQWDLSAGSYDSGAIRFVRLRQFLAITKPDAVFYEFVRNTPAEAVTRYNAGALLARVATSSQLFGAFQAHVCCWCEENDVPCTSFSIQEIKKRATGKGNASKVDVIKAANKEFGLDLDPDGYESSGVDNVADSVYVCMLGLEQYGKGLT